MPGSWCRPRSRGCPFATMARFRPARSRRRPRTARPDRTNTIGRPPISWTRTPGTDAQPASVVTSPHGARPRDHRSTGDTRGGQAHAHDAQSGRGARGSPRPGPRLARMRPDLQPVHVTVPPAIENKRSHAEYQVRRQVQWPEPLRLDRVLHLLVCEAPPARPADAVRLTRDAAAVHDDIAERDRRADERTLREGQCVEAKDHPRPSTQQEGEEKTGYADGKTDEGRRQCPEFSERIGRPAGPAAGYARLEP